MPVKIHAEDDRIGVPLSGLPMLVYRMWKREFMRKITKTAAVRPASRQTHLTPHSQCILCRANACSIWLSQSRLLLLL